MKSTTHRVELHGSTVHVGNLEVRLDAAAEYMRGIPSDKWEAAFVHAVQVGMTEIMARRRRFQMEAHAPAPVSARVPAPVPAAAPVRTAPPAAKPHDSIVARVEEKRIQPAVTLPPEPRMETVRESSSETPSIAAAQPAEIGSAELPPSRTATADHQSRGEGGQPCPPESENWLRRLDDDLETLDSVHALDQSGRGR